jgi:DNA-binding NarL/FixJ family response regulator
LIDDDDLIAGSLRLVLASHGCRVDVAADSCAAAAMMADKHYDVVLVDPYLTGAVHQASAALIADIRAQQPSAALIVLTGYGSPEIQRSVADGLVSAILTKPQSVAFLSQFLLAASTSAGRYAPLAER